MRIENVAVCMVSLIYVPYHLDLDDFLDDLDENSALGIDWRRLGYQLLIKVTQDANGSMVHHSFPSKMATIVSIQFWTPKS